MLQLQSFDDCKQLSGSVIAMNPRRNGNKGAIYSYNLDSYKELTRQAWLSQLIGQIRALTLQQNELMAESLSTVDEMLAGKVNENAEKLKQITKQIETLKKQLPFRSPHYFHFLDNHRAQKSIDPEAFTFQTTIDIDDPEEVENAVKYALLLNGVFFDDVELDFKTHIFKEEDIDRWQGKVLHIERSARNNFIYREACLLRYICNSEAAWIKEVILTFGEDEQKAFATVESACKTNQMAVMPDIVRQAVELARKRFIAQQATEKAGIYADVPPQMPDRLPRLIKLLTSKVPADFKPAIACAVFPSLAAHLKGVSFRYIDNQMQEAALMNLLVAPMSSGKSLVNGPIDCIMQDMAQLDQISRDKEQEWKDDVNTMGDNKKKPVRPDNICIRIVSPDLTRAAYIQRLDDAQKSGDAYLYCKMDEVDCKKARQLAERLEGEIMEAAQLADNKAYAEFAKRALANGYRKAMVHYLANGEKWEKAIEDFIEWSVKYDLWCKMRFFGMKMEEAIDSDRRLVNHSGPSNLLAFVPDTFSLVDIQAVYQMQGKKGRLSALLTMWAKRGHIVKNADGTFSKTERFIAKYGHYGTPMAASFCHFVA